MDAADQLLAGEIPKELVLDCRVERQLSPEWCWASCTVGIARFLKTDPAPTEPILANLITGRTDCEAKPTPRACIVPAQPVQIAQVYRRLGIDRVGPDIWLSQPTLVWELVRNGPVEVGWLWPNGGGHVGLVRGWDRFGRWLVSDPWFGERKVYYAELLTAYPGPDGMIGTWAYSYGRFKRAAN